MLSKYWRQYSRNVTRDHLDEPTELKTSGERPNALSREQTSAFG